jgi:hypothetical protein
MSIPLKRFMKSFISQGDILFRIILHAKLCAVKAAAAVNIDLFVLVSGKNLNK